MEIHNINPVYDKNSRVLVLGSFPSVKSRQQQFFYGHPQNRFWKVLAAIFDDELPESIEEKKRFLLKNHVAVWDVIQSCEITESSDSSIDQVTANDLSQILNTADIQHIFCNGSKSYDLFQKYMKQKITIKTDKLPSTSPANAQYSLTRLIKEWKILKEYR